MTVKTEKRDGSTTNNPYVAFRRRTEKMQTRKNRKNDETSYEKMLKLRRDLNRAVTLLELIKRREKSKKEMVKLTIEVLEKRFQMEDFEGKVLADAEAIRHKLPPFIPPSFYKDWGQGDEVVVRKKREYRKRKHKPSVSVSQPQNQTISAQPTYPDVDSFLPDVYSSEEGELSPMSPSDHEDENDPDGMFAFRRKRSCNYYAPILNRLGNWSWCSSEDGGLGEKKYRYSLTSISQPQRCVGFARRRIGRGGRVIIDRAFTPWDDGLCSADLSGSGSYSGVIGDYITHIRDKKIPHYRPHSPPPEGDTSHSHFGSNSFSSSQDSAEFNMESFQSHREQLLQMQRDQQEQLLRQETSELDTSYNGLEHSFSSQPTSRFTLDSDSAKFAVSAVMNSSQLQQQQSATSTSTINGASSISVDTSISPLLNGPILDTKPAGLSTSPAANVLQLNFPINPLQSAHNLASSLSSSLSSVSVTSSALSSALSSSLPSSSPATTLIPSSTSFSSVNNLTSKTITSFNSNILKLASHNSSMEPSLKQNLEDSKPLNSLGRDTVMAMDVT